jgi:hypothetical protein
VPSHVFTLAASMTWAPAPITCAPTALIMPKSIYVSKSELSKWQGKALRTDVTRRAAAAARAYVFVCLMRGMLARHSANYRVCLASRNM